MTPRLTIVTAEALENGADSRPVILLAESDRLRGALITASLEDAGVEVVWVPHGDAALASAEETAFDAHVVDPSLVSGQGERIVESLVVEHPRVPLVLTGRSAARLHVASTRIPPAELVDLVHTALARATRADRRTSHELPRRARETLGGE